MNKEELLNLVDLDGVAEYLDDNLTTYNNYDELTDTESVSRWIYEQDIIYYSVAIDYLSKNDPSLHESLSIANELGYSLDNLSSEILATLHYQQSLFETLFEGLEKYEEEIKAYYKED